MDISDTQGPTEEKKYTTANLSLLVIPLLKGILYQENNPAAWNALLGLQSRIRDYVGVIGLELILDEAEGYAYLRAHPQSDESAVAKLPRLIARRQLSFPISLLLALLRKKLAEHDASGEGRRLILSRDAIVDTVRIFLPQSSNEARLTDQVDANLNKIIELGFVRKLHGQDNMFEILRILKAFVDAQWLAEFETRLSEYHQHVNVKNESLDE